MASRTSRVSGFGFESAAVPMMVIGAEGMILHANPAIHRLLGYAVGSLNGCIVDYLAPPTERAAMMLLRAAGENATGLQIRSRALRSDGRVIDVRMTVEPCSADSADVFVSYQPLAPWEAQRADAEQANDQANDQTNDSGSSERLAG